MKKTNRLLALLLCAALVLSLFGCTTDPAPTQTPTDPPAPTDPPGANLYASALPALENAADVTLTITTSTSTIVAGQEFRKGSQQTLTRTGLGTQTPTIASTDVVNYDGINFVEYQETYVDGVLYLDAENANAGQIHYFSAETDPADADARYLPVTLLDAALYGSIAQEQTADGTLLRFTEPAAAERWAAPEDAVLKDAAGTALLDENGALTRFTYTITYTYGPAKITYEVCSDISLGASPAAAPVNETRYIPLTDLDAVRLNYEGQCYLAQGQQVTSSYMESSVSEAVGLVQNQSFTVDLYYTELDLDAKFVSNIYVNAQGESMDYKLEEWFVDGKYTAATDGGEPEAVSGVTPDMVNSYGQDALYISTINPLYWADATVTDLGSTYLMECTLSEDGGMTVRANVCESLFGSADLLDSYATDSGISECKGYFAVDKYTGLPTAAGYSLDAFHTIEGQDCALTYQVDQSFDVPALGAYYSITDKLPPEARPAAPAEPLFYHVTGADGQEMWLLGTIHVGDIRTGYLPQEIYNAFSASDALALEYDSVAFEDELEEDEKLQEAISEAYYYADGTTIADHLDPELYEAAVQYLKATGNYNMNAEYMKPYLWSSSIDNFHLRQGYSLTSHQGVESRLEKLAEEAGKEVRSVESGLFQIRMLTGYSDALQELLLGESVSTDAVEYWQHTNELYELWCQGDEAALREALEDDLSDLTEEELALYNEYNDAMLVDRNAGMLDVAIDYLESGDVVFYAVGLAHLLTGNGLVDTLREAGYTVELVTYAK